MNAFEIAKRISFQKQKNYTRFIVRLSIAATAISVAAILITLSIVNGFQQTVSNKVYAFWGQLRIASVNGMPLEKNDSLKARLVKIPSVESIYPFLNQSTVLSYEQDIEGVVARGIVANAPIPFIIEGRNIQSSNDSMVSEVVLSDHLTKTLNITLDATVRLYFLNIGEVQQRKLKVVGIYHSGIEDYDKQYILVDLKLLQQLNHHPNEIEGYTLLLEKNANIDQVNDQVQTQMPPNWVATTTKDYYPQIFDWIGVQTVNRNVTITIMLLIAIVNLLTCLFILMLERIPMIGTLTALGATPGFIRQIFLYQASFICWMGIGMGSILGLGLCYLQKQFGWIQLDESAYFIKTLPIEFNAYQIILVLLGTAIISYVSFLIPTLWIKKIAPAKAIKFD
ncbi:MAG: ABC transporter permease [Bacteroidetes bacterium]|nr:ABC transporter permease [Bacteroidota bacterium]